MVNFTPFEEQVFHVLADITLSHTGAAVSSWHIAERGHKLFGESWGGAPVYDRLGVERYPLLDRFLSRLEKKGIVTRSASEWAVSEGLSYHLWTLTNEGLLLVGIDS